MLPPEYATTDSREVGRKSRAMILTMWFAAAVLALGQSTKTMAVQDRSGTNSPVSLKDTVGTAGKLLSTPSRNAGGLCYSGVCINHASFPRSSPNVPTNKFLKALTTPVFMLFSETIPPSWQRLERSGEDWVWRKRALIRRLRSS